nr:immunoglobulin heavy chain junction region [Mus musculus]
CAKGYGNYFDQW